ncbi:MAG: hypothetical protein JWN77_1266 [Frankiales bacterium]|jgi:hypothetical protein|nr:hypothetical protein [Frankiales bacterium]
MRRTPLLATTVALVLASAGAASAAGGTGTVTDTLLATVAAGPLTLAGVGASVALSPTPGAWTASTGATALTVSDLTGTTNGWAVTATYTAPAAGITALGADNVKVSVTDVTGALTGAAVSPVTDAPLTTPVTVASTGLAAGTGVTVLTSAYKVRVPASATVGQVYGGTVTYTVASVR